MIWYILTRFIGVTLAVSIVATIVVAFAPAYRMQFEPVVDAVWVLLQIVVFGPALLRWLFGKKNNSNPAH